MTIQDFKGRIYKLIELRVNSTLLEDVQTGERVTIRNHNWDAIGFVRP